MSHLRLKRPKSCQRSFYDPISLQVRYLGIKKLEEEACKFKEPLTTTEIHSATTETDHNNHGDQVRGHS